MSRLLILVSNILFLVSFTYGCSGQSQGVPTDISTVNLITLESGMLISDEINSLGLVKVDEGLIVSDRSDCLPKDCAYSVWDIIQQGPLAFAGSNSSMQLAISIRSFQIPEDAYSSAVRISGNGGQPGFQLIEIPAQTLPEQSWAYAEDGRFVLLVTVYENIQILISLSEQTWKINEPEKAVALLADLAKMQIDKLMLSNNR